MAANTVNRCCWCYVGMPLSGMILWCFSRRDRQLRFHVRQSICFGSLYVGILMGFSLLDAVGGAFFRWAGAFVAAAAPVVGVFTTMLWGVTVVRVLRGHHGRIPVISTWADT